MNETPPPKAPSRGRVLARRITDGSVLAVILNDIFVLPMGYSTLNDSWVAEVMAVAIVPGTLIAIGSLIAFGYRQPWKTRRYPLFLGVLLLLSLPLGSGSLFSPRDLSCASSTALAYRKLLGSRESATNMDPSALNM